jgi:hypothetical protein
MPKQPFLNLPYSFLDMYEDKIGHHPKQTVNRFISFCKTPK